MYQPLAESLRPKTLTEVIGQTHLIGAGMPLSILDAPQSIILWGPPGVGKTTIARIMANKWHCHFIELSALSSGIKEIKQVLDQADNSQLLQQGTVIFIDEIHRFNTIQQDAFLHHLESGKIILIGATTENPSFKLNNALLSRTHVYVLELLSAPELELVCTNGLNYLNTFRKNNNQLPLVLQNKAREILISVAGGDARRLLNILELLNNCVNNNIDSDLIKQVLPAMLHAFDNQGEHFYNQISALHKSVRGSDVDASIYWLMRMLDGGVDPLYIGRRLLRIAWEDVGLADIQASTIVLNAIQTYERLGDKEGNLALVQACIYLAVTPKSNSGEVAFNKALQYIKQTPAYPVPLHLRNAPTKLMAELNYAKDYKYAHDYPNHYVPNEHYFPDEIKSQQFYTPTQQGLEQKISTRLDFLQELDKQSKK
jgi:putative ATPase